MKLGIKDIKILSEGQQAKQLILTNYSSYDDFIEKNNLNLVEASVNSYLKRKEITSDTFKIALTNAFNKGYPELIYDAKNQIINYIETIAAGINEYTDEKDINVLTKLKELCITYEMEKELGQVYWLHGIYYYYNMKKTNTGIEFMILALNYVKGDPLLTLEYYSDMGLVFYYERNYENCRKYLEDARKMLHKLDKINKSIAHVLYYRYGLLLNNTNNHIKAREMFKLAFDYAEEETNKGSSLMNIGLTHKKCNEYAIALDYYTKALQLSSGNNVKMSIIYNNLAELYNVMGYKEDALTYINEAFSLLGGQEPQKYFVYFTTYTQIMSRFGNNSRILDSLLELVNRNKESIHKTYIVDAIYCVTKIMYESEDLLSIKAIDNLVTDLIRSTEQSDFKKELINCLGNLYLIIKEMELK